MVSTQQQRQVPIPGDQHYPNHGTTDGQTRRVRPGNLDGVSCLAAPCRPPAPQTLWVLAAAVSTLPPPAPVRQIQHKDLAEGHGRVQQPNALRRKYPNAPVAWSWQWLLPQSHRWQDPATGQQGRHDLDPSLIQKALRRAVLAVGIHKSAQPTSCSSRYKWIAGPITTVRHERMSPKALAVTRASWTVWMWLTESSRSGSAVLGNHPNSVRHPLSSQ